MGLYFVLGFGALVLGCIFGSFLNALLFRFNTGKGMGGRSRCMRCNRVLSSLDLVPIFSYLYLRGRCRYCGVKVSLQYPLVESAAAALSLGVFVLAYPDLIHYALWLVVWLTILFIVVYDLRHMIIPWSASLTLLGLVLSCLFFDCVTTTCHLPPATLLSGPALALPLFLVSLFSGGRWMGWADSLFELSLGWLLGLSMGLTALMLAVWSGAAVGIMLLAVSKRATMNMKSEIPFAPFLALGASAAFFFHVDFFSTISLLF